MGIKCWPLVVASAVALVGCPLSHHRSADAPEPDAATPPPLGTCPMTTPPGGFSASEVYLEPDSPGCTEERPECMVYGLRGDPSESCAIGCPTEDEVALRVFCTCECLGPHACACGEDEECTTLGLSPERYCIPRRALRP